MRFPASILEEIKARLPVSAVVGRRVRLQKAGREFKGLSPFNAEKTPSFFVNDQKQRYFDFSSGKNGDIFSFLMETEGLSFNEAVERLAAEAGVALPKVTQEAIEQEEKRQSLHDVMELAAAFFESQLAGQAGASARAYLDRRGLSPDTRKRFRLGYAPNERYALRDHLAGKGVSSDDMIEVGLLVTGDDIAVPYDKFRDRVMFPICDARGRVVGFGGRALQADVPAKYMNSPETPLFHKGRLLYNLHNARKAAHDRGTVIAVEGYVDVIAMAVAGFPHTVAPLGTALTEDQLGLLWRMAEEPILCFDGDKAGRRAAYRAIDVALPLLQPGKSLRFALLPEGQDPDDLAKSGGALAIESVLNTARPLVDLLWQREVEASPLDTPERRAAFERRMGEVVRSIGDETLRRHYRAEIDQRLAAFLPALAGPYGRERGERGGGWRESYPQGGAGGGQRRFRHGRPGERMPGPLAQPLRPSSALANHPLFAAVLGHESPREALILSLLLAHGPLLYRYGEELADLGFSGRDARHLAARIIDVLMHHDPRGDDFAPAIQALMASDAARRLRALVRPGDAWTLDPEGDSQAAEDALRQALTLHRRAHALHSELKAAEKALADDDSEANFAWLRDVQAQLSSLDGAEAEFDGDEGPGRMAGHGF
jgi:DNA primase